MFKLSLLVVSVILLVVCEMTSAGDCKGSSCGCYKGYCWAYVSGSETRPGDWWCYTQKEGTVGKQSNWESCSNDHDCSWNRSCGSCRQYKGIDYMSRSVCWSWTFYYWNHFLFSTFHCNQKYLSETCVVNNEKTLYFSLK